MLYTSEGHEWKSFVAKTVGTMHHHLGIGVSVTPMIAGRKTDG